nr:MAG TPA: hypothetical protein [Caudoviricetes sp.]
MSFYPTRLPSIFAKNNNLCSLFNKQQPPN